MVDSVQSGTVGERLGRSELEPLPIVQSETVLERLGRTEYVGKEEPRAGTTDTRVIYSSEMCKGTNQFGSLNKCGMR